MDSALPGTGACCPGALVEGQTPGNQYNQVDTLLALEKKRRGGGFSNRFEMT